ncbi:MAG: hypothetical protein DME32_17330 [Verrucomicrobia bacterium]|nr:MAG: hypothetical protein DME32_17330 [Verrucomicrobiota bacterium]
MAHIKLATGCGGRRAACEIKELQPTRLPLQVYFGASEATIFQTADRRGAVAFKTTCAVPWRCEAGS